MDNTSPKNFVSVHWRNFSSINPLVCYPYSMISTGTIWKGQNPLQFAYPLFLLDLIIVILTTRSIAFLLRPLHQPRYISELIGGIVLGPQVMGRIPNFTIRFFPLRSVLMMETVAYLGVLYFIFIVAVELDLSGIKCNVGRSAAFAAVCMFIPFTIGGTYAAVTQPVLNDGVNHSAFLAYVGVALSVTAFSILARKLAELKIINSDVGAIVLSSAVLIDGWAWVLLATVIAIAQNEGQVLATVCTAVSGVSFVLACFTVVRPALQWLVAEEEEVDELHACGILVGVLVSAVVADMIGINAVSGAFIFGLVIPQGPLSTALVERVEDFVEGMLLPLYFAVSGLRTNLHSIDDTEGAVVFVLVVLAVSVAKVVGCQLLGYMYKMPSRDGLAIGLLMNTKGIMEMVFLTMGMDKMILTMPFYTILVFMSVTVTAVVNPLLLLVVKSSGHRPTPHRRRTVQWPNHEAELRVLVCVHGTRNVPSMIDLVEASNPTKRSPIYIYALHLIQLTGRTSSILIIHNHHRSKYGRGNRRQANASLPTSSDHIMHAFENYEQHAVGVCFQALTTISPYTTMHRDICSVAEDKYVALVILPFHKQPTVDGSMGVANNAIRALNQNVLDSAPCSIGILVDRSIEGGIRVTPGQRTAHHVALVFLGGPDDREALAFASRMAGHLGIDLTVLRLIHVSSPRSGGRAEREWQLDEECISEFRLGNVDNESVVYDERDASNSGDTLTAVRSLDGIPDMYIVGRGRGEKSPLTAGLNEWSECPELGPIGDVLASSDFAGTASVLVVQRCPTAPMPTPLELGAVAPDSLGRKLKASPNKADPWNLG